MSVQTYRLFKKSIDTYWPIGEVVIPETVWTSGWNGVIEYLQKENRIYGDGTYAVQNILGLGLCVFSVEVPEPDLVITIL